MSKESDWFPVSFVCCRRVNLQHKGRASAVEDPNQERVDNSYVCPVMASRRTFAASVHVDPESAKG